LTFGCKNVSNESIELSEISDIFFVSIQQISKSQVASATSFGAMSDNSVKKILILAANPIDTVRLSLAREVQEIRTTLQLIT
jgi:hypothetical protein